MQLEGPDAVQASAVWTADDDLHSTNLLCADSFRFADMLGTGIALLALLTGSMALNGTYRVPIIVALCLAALSVWYFDTARRVRRHRRTEHSTLGESMYGLDRHGVHWEGLEGNSFTRWKAIRAFTQTPRFWRFDVIDGTVLMIPRAGLTPADDAAVATAMNSFADKIGGADPQ